MKKLHDYLIHAYMLASIVATLFFIPYPDMSMWCYTLGGSSSLYAIAYILGVLSSAVLGILAFLWMILFPILMLIFYILAMKEIYLPFYIITTIDTVFILVTSLALSINVGSPLIESFFFWDAIISTAFSVVLGGLLLYRRNHLEKYL